jgi:hypothetical protein
MIIFTALLVPIIISLVLFLFFKHKTLWWEFLLPFAAALIVGFIFKFAGEYSRTIDTEYWSGTIVKAEYYEEWDEYIEQTCSSTCCCDSKGNNCQTTYYDCSYVDYHYPYWVVSDNNGETRRVSEQEYKRLVKRFGNQKEVELGRDYHSIDGDKYITYWDNRDVTLECMVTKHSYENRVQASSSTFNFEDVDTTEITHYGLYKYPNITGYYDQVNLLGNHPKWKEMNRKLEILNAKLGNKKQLKTFVLIFDSKLREAGLKQEAYWKGGNKNEFVICIGLDGNGNVAWCHPFSWTEAQITKVNIRSFVESQKKLELNSVIDYSYKELESNFIRKPFADFSYLTVEPTGWQIFWTFIITLLVNVGVVVYVIQNEFDEQTEKINARWRKNNWFNRLIYKK